MSQVRFEMLRRGHDRSAFSCGRPPLDDFLRLRATQYEKRDLARTYVAVEGDSPRALGFYSLSAGSVDLSAIPEAEALRLPRHHVPVILLARLAVDVAAQGRGLGRDLLTDALVRSWTLSGSLGIHAVEVHALDDPAASFYRKYGFAALRDDERHLYLALATIRANFADEGGDPTP
jgi:GNAT superfamily N-acetyltransferase